MVITLDFTAYKLEDMHMAIGGVNPQEQNVELIISRSPQSDVDPGVTAFIKLSAEQAALLEEMLTVSREHSEKQAVGKV